MSPTIIPPRPRPEPSRTSFLILALLVPLVLAAAARPAAAFEAWIEVVEQSGANEITVTVSDPSPPPQPELVGYRVVRYVHGVCEDPVQLTATLPFDTPTSVVDQDPPMELACTYAVTGVTADGAAWSFPTWNGIATLGGPDRPVLRGWLVSGGVFGGGMMFACPDMCWELPLLTGFPVGVQAAPAELLESVDTGQIFDVYGEIDYAFEGPFFTSITAVTATDCDAVATAPVTWSALRQRFR